MTEKIESIVAEASIYCALVSPKSFGLMLKDYEQIIREAVEQSIQSFLCDTPINVIGQMKPQK